MAAAGRFRDRVQVLRAPGADALDAYGNPAGEWAQVGAFWASLRETPGKERLVAGRQDAAPTATLRLRASRSSRAVSSDDRIVARGGLWAITAAPVDPDGRGMVIEFLLERLGAASDAG